MFSQVDKGSFVADVKERYSTEVMASEVAQFLGFAGPLVAQ